MNQKSKMAAGLLGIFPGAWGGGGFTCTKASFG